MMFIHFHPKHMDNGSNIMPIIVEKIGKKSAKCSKCDSQLTYTQYDVKSHRTNCDYLGDCDIVNGIECPVCNNIIKDR
jgi:hypothetical protein